LPKTESRKLTTVLGLALAGLGLFFLRLGAPGLMDPDEGRYAEIAREMWVLRDWLTPHLNFLPYLEKPPLVYWLTALSFGGLGETEFAARLPAALSALGGVFLAWWLARRLWGPRPAWMGAMVLASSAGYVALGRILTLDMAFSLWLNLGLALGYVALSRGQPRLWPWAYLALGLAALTKGPAALVLAGLVWGLWLLLTRQSIRPFIQPWSWLLLAVVALPWFILVGLAVPEFWRFFIIEQHLARFLQPAIHPEPIYYFLPVLAGLMLPWTWLMPWALGARELRQDRDCRFLLLWAGVIIGFFSLSKGKLPTYILPALLPLALLMGRRLAELTAAAPEWGLSGLRISLALWALSGVILLALYLAAPPALVKALSKGNLWSPWLLALAILSALPPLAALIWRRVTLLLAGALALSLLIPVALERLSEIRSPRQAAGLALAHWQPGAALVGLQLYSQGLSFYCRQPMYFWEGKTELDFGRKVKPQNPYVFTTRAEMAAFAASRPRTFFYVKDPDLPGLARDLPHPLRLLGRQKDCLLMLYDGK
jgi:4-amino-4-deoxy-L-arabinose transferase-like glycosyltransferase